MTTAAPDHPSLADHRLVRVFVLFLVPVHLFVRVGAVNFGAAGLVGGIVGVACATAYVTTKHYIANNLLGTAFCMQVLVPAHELPPRL